MSPHYRLYTYVFRSQYFNDSWTHSFYVANTTEGDMYAMEAAKREMAEFVYRLPATKKQSLGKLIWSAPIEDGLCVT